MLYEVITAEDTCWAAVYGEKGVGHRCNRTRRFLPGGTVVEQGVRGSWHHPSCEYFQHGATGSDL